MERRLTKKVQEHIDNLKTDIFGWIANSKYSIIDPITQGDKMTDFKTFIGNYKDITFSKEDFLKRKRVKNVAPQCERCIAKRANGTQCTRRKKDSSQHCGTHSKGTPHGEMTIGDNVATIKKIDVWTEDFTGINYYIDSENNVYNTQDIMQNIPNPRVIAQWVMNSDGKYSIPELGV